MFHWTLCYYCVGFPSQQVKIYMKISEKTPITLVVSSNHAHGEVYSIQHYLINFVSDLPACPWFSPISSNNKTNHHNITEILLKVALNTINFRLRGLGLWCSMPHSTIFRWNNPINNWIRLFFWIGNLLPKVHGDPLHYLFDLNTYFWDL